MLEPQPATSRDAFASIKLNDEEQAVLAIIRECANGITADEIERIRGCGHQRLVSLRRKRLIYRSDLRRETRSGRSAFVYFATPQSEK
jgi:chromosome segregation and condensation protein ScpB